VTSFAHPTILWLLLLVPPALILFFWSAWRDRQKLMTQFIQARLLPGLIAGLSPARWKIRAALLVGAVTCLILALARPQFGFDWQEVTQRGLDIVIAIDTSKSMLAEDITPNRLARAKLAALDLMQQAKSDRLGLVAFAGSAFLQCPLTIDDTAFRQSLDALDVNTIPEGGSALAEAIKTATKAFKEGESHKVLVLFSDGEDHDSNAIEAAKTAHDAGVIIFTIGIGSPEGEILQTNIRDENGNVVKSRLNEALLQQLAGPENGFYLALRGANTMDTLYEKGIAPLPKSEAQEKLVKRPRERYHWPLGMAMALLIVEMLFPERKRDGSRSKRRQMPPVEGSISSKAPTAVLALVLWLAPGVAFASASSALKDYKAGKFIEAQKEYERLAAEDKKGDFRFAFNAGTAAYRATNYDAAIKLFTTVLASPDVKLQQSAYFNIGNAQFQLGYAGKDLDELQRWWEAAIKSYQNAVTLDKTDADAAYNLEFAKRGVEQILQLRLAARQAKEAADEATRRRNYHRALEIMQGLMQQSPLAKQFEDYTKKLQDIDAIANPPPQ
jgi:Ca-activated chloride channel homolog